MTNSLIAPRYSSMSWLTAMSMEPGGPRSARPGANMEARVACQSASIEKPLRAG